MEQLTRKGRKASLVETAAPMPDPALREQIAARAYQLFLQRNQVHGHDVDDWLEAERSIMTERRSRKRGRA